MYEGTKQKLFCISPHVHIYPVRDQDNETCKMRHILIILKHLQFKLFIANV